jgi:long-chain acyl-CoA synthetase
VRQKLLGIWQEITWSEYWNKIEDVAYGLIALGVEPGDRVAIQSENRPEWIVADAACSAIRATCMGLYPTNPAAEVEYLMADSASKILIAEDQEQVDKALAVRDRLPALERIIYIEPRGTNRYDDEILLSWDEFVEMGNEQRSADARLLSRKMAEAEADDIVYLIYTSGTTGPPKGAMLSARNVEFACSLLDSSGGFVDPAPGPSDDLISFLPLCHVYEKAFGHWLNASAGTVTNFGESLDTLTVDMREIQPTIFEAVPRIWEKMHAAILIRMASASRFKKLNYSIWMKTANRIGKKLVANGGTWTFSGRVQYWIGYVFLFRALKERLGLTRCRHGITAAAPIAPEIIEFFMGIGVPVYEAYGMTENAAISTTNRPGRVILGTVGEPYDGVEIRLDDSTGEILVRHPGVFVGYWNKPEASAQTIDADRWLHTGDVGEWVGENLKIVDRLKDIIITAGGKNISPSEIENLVKMSPFVGEAIVIGDRRKYVSALIAIDFDATSEWAQRRRLAHTTYRDLSEKPEVRELIQSVITEANGQLASVEQIKQFGFIKKELDHEDGELTATMKVKRSVIASQFADEIETLYR